MIILLLFKFSCGYFQESHKKHMHTDAYYGNDLVIWNIFHQRRHTLVPISVCYLQFASGNLDILYRYRNITLLLYNNIIVNLLHKINPINQLQLISYLPLVVKHNTINQHKYSRV